MHWGNLRGTVWGRAAACFIIQSRRLHWIWPLFLILAAVQHWWDFGSALHYELLLKKWNASVVSVCSFNPTARINVGSFSKPRKCWNCTFLFVAALYFFRFTFWLSAVTTPCLLSGLGLGTETTLSGIGKNHISAWNKWFWHHEHIWRCPGLLYR